MSVTVAEGCVPLQAYQFGHRGYVAVKGGAQDSPNTDMTDLAVEAYRLPWEDSVRITTAQAGVFLPRPAFLGRPQKKQPNDHDCQPTLCLAVER
ncbi:MAG: hypothetical protein ACK4GC_03345 [Paracoccaceae bacterium]